MPVTVTQRISRALIKLAEDPATTIEQKLAALAQLTQLHKGRQPLKRKPRKAKSASNLLG